MNMYEGEAHERFIDQNGSQPPIAPHCFGIPSLFKYGVKPAHHYKGGPAMP